MKSKAVMIEMDPEARALMERVREALVRRNIERTQAGDFSHESATFKSIVQRGIAAVAREVLAEI